MTDEIARLRRANPLPDLAAAPPAPAMAGAPRPPRRAVRWAAGAAGAAALGGLIAALIVATPSGDHETTAADRTLRVSLLERPGGHAVLRPPPRQIDPGSVHLAARAAGIEWFAAQRLDHAGTTVCLLSFGDDDRVVLHRCAPIARGLIAGARREGARLRIAGIVPDGIGTVTIGRRTVAVHDNAFTITTRRRPDIVILQGPSAPLIPRRPDVVVATHVGDPPAVAVSFDPEPGPAGPAAVRGTLREAAAAMPFAVMAPDPAPRGVPSVAWTDPVPGVVPQIVITYLRTSGPGISVTERAAAPGALDRRPAIVRDMPDGAVVRTVLAGTVAEVRGPQDALDDLLAVAASLRPVAP